VPLPGAVVRNNNDSIGWARTTASTLQRWTVSKVRKVTLKKYRACADMRAAKRILAHVTAELRTGGIAVSVQN
jgi:hypothetical protein